MVPHEVLGELSKRTLTDAAETDLTGGGGGWDGGEEGNLRRKCGREGGKERGREVGKVRRRGGVFGIRINCQILVACLHAMYTM